MSEAILDHFIGTATDRTATVTKCDNKDLGLNDFTVITDEPVTCPKCGASVILSWDVRVVSAV